MMGTALVSDTFHYRWWEYRLS